MTSRRGARKSPASSVPKPTGPGISRPQLELLGQRFKHIDDILSPISKIVIFITIVLGGYQYFYNQHEIRVERTLDYVAEWTTGGYRDAFDRLNQSIWPIYTASAEFIDATAKTEEQRNFMLANIGERISASSDEAAKDVDIIFDYFERAALCANERLCDLHVLNTFLGGEARTFWRYFSRYAGLKNATGYTAYGYWTGRLAAGQIQGRLFFGWL